MDRGPLVVDGHNDLPWALRRAEATGQPDWRIMFEPIRARLASSCSRNGIIAVATLTICFGLTSM